MSNPETTDITLLEADGRFPSGTWQGYFLQREFPGRHRMDLRLEFKQGQIDGDGRDWVGPFRIRGRYDLESGKCWWTKHYLGKHDVLYAGYNEGKGIWGTWDIPPHYRGGFHIWPEGMQAAASGEAAAETDLPAVSPVLSD